MRSLLPLPFLILAACSEYGITKPGGAVIGNPMIEVDPGSLSFEGAVEGEQQTQSFTIRSVGDASVTIEPLFINGSGSFTLLSGDRPGIMPPETEAVVEVAYMPASELDSGQVVVLNNSADPRVMVDLLGSATQPELEVSPMVLDFGNVTANTSETLYLSLSNVGTGTIHVTGIEAPQAPYSVPWSSQIDIAEGDSAEMEVTVSPTDFGTFDDTLVIHSNDPDGDTTVVLQSMSAQVPTAQCSVAPNPVATIHEAATFTGSGFDPQGLAITTYSWTLIGKPAGSSAVMPNTNSSTIRNFYTDVIGTYTAQLVVTNSQGQRSEPCVVDLLSEADSDLWVEMYWQYSGDDMDLHLLAPGGVLRTTNDCYYANCTSTFGGLDWGIRGSGVDDPILDLDDIPGVGPENINIGTPASGLYTVYVNDYPGSVYQGRNDVTINIYLGGALVWTDTRPITGENSDEPFATIDWPSMVVTAL